MPPKRKAAAVVAVCPITQLPIDGNLKKRLKASAAVTEKTIKKVMENTLGLTAPTGERDDLINAYADALANQKAGASAASPSPPPAAPARASSAKGGGRSAAKATPVEEKAVTPPPSKPAPKAIVRQRSSTTTARSKAPPSPQEDLPSPVASPIYVHNSSPSPVKPLMKPAPKTPKAKPSGGGGGGGTIKFLVWLVVVALGAFVLFVYAAPRVKGLLPAGISQQADKAHTSALVLTRTASDTAVSNFNWLSQESMRLVEAARTTITSMLAPPPAPKAKEPKKEEKKSEARQAAPPPPPPPPSQPKAPRAAPPAPEPVVGGGAAPRAAPPAPEPVVEGGAAADGGSPSPDGPKKKKKKSKKKLTEDGQDIPEAAGGAEEPPKQVVPLSQVPCSDFSFFDCTGDHDYDKCEAKRDKCKESAPASD